MSFWRKDHNGADWLGEVAFFEGFTPEDLQRVVESANWTFGARYSTPSRRSHSSKFARHR